MKKITLFLTLMFILLRGLASAQEAVKMSLDDAIKYAMANASSLKNARANINDATLRVKESKAGGLPKVDADVSLQRFIQQPSVPASALGFGTPSAQQLYAADYSENRLRAIETKNGLTAPPYTPPSAGEDTKIAFQQKNNFTGGITVSQLLFSGSYTVALRAARYYKDLVNVQLTKEEEMLRNKVIDAYLPALSIDDAVKTFDKNLVNLEKLKSEVAATYKAGFVEQLDIDRLDFSINNLKAQRDNLVRQRDLPISALKLVINYPMDKPLELSDDINSLLKPISEQEINAAIDFQKRSEIRELDATLKLTELNVELQKASGLPTVAAFFNYQYAVQGNTFSTLFGVPSALLGVTAKYNIWDNHERKIKMERAMIDVEKLRTAKTDVEKAIIFQGTIAKIAINSAQKNIDAQQKNLNLAQKIYDVTKKKYQEGVGSSLELISAERDIYAAQQTIRQAQFDLLKAQMDLLKALGR